MTSIRLRGYMLSMGKTETFSRSYRQAINSKHFSEGARQLWLKMELRGWSQAEVRRRLAKASPKKTAGLLSRWLYGDQRPGAEWTAVIESALGIKARLWGMPPTEPFVAPAARAAANEQGHSPSGTGTEG